MSDLDFVKIKTKPLGKKDGSGILIYPEFLVKKSKDLMIRGNAFYAIWDEDRGFWSKNEDDVQRLVDQMIFSYAEKFGMEPNTTLSLMQNFSSNKWTEWQRYCKSLPDNYHGLDEQITFSNVTIKKESYVTRTLPYPMKDDPTPAYDELMNVLYAKEERQKLEWAIGSIISGDSKNIQKFIVLYGGPGTGKSTVLNIIEKMFTGYCSVFESKALGSSNNAFALEAFRENPLVAIQHDGDLSHIEDNTKLNSIVSHESMIVNEKYKATYSSQFHSFLFMGTNKPVRITDAKSGILRRLIDVSPTGKKLSRDQFDQLISQIDFELGGIANHCYQVYQKLGFSYYDGYTPTSMMGATNDFYNFIMDNYDFFSSNPEGGISLTSAWARYKEYCEDANITYPYTKRIFKEELKSYFLEFYDRFEGRRSIYMMFKDPSEEVKTNNNQKEDGSFELPEWLQFSERESIFDSICKDCPAQYASQTEKPMSDWDKTKTTLSDLDTKKLHYVRPPEKLICIDLDKKDDSGQKSFIENARIAAQFPPTYAELSKGGAGIHLHYYYEGDVSELSHIYGENVEIKVFSGKSSLRRKLSVCNAFPITSISSGLPKKEKKKVINGEKIKSERSLRDLIRRNLKKEIHPSTKCSIDFIYDILNGVYQDGLHYDVTDLRPAIQNFAMNSTHNADYCLRKVSQMKFQSEEQSENVDRSGDSVPIIFYDLEVLPNLFVMAWKKQGKDQKKVIWYNPKPADIEKIIQFRLVGFNNRKYDNHILYARMMGYSEEQLFHLSQSIINEKTGFFGEAYNLSYTDIYDYLSSDNKMSLKKWEIKLGIHHQELGLPWDQPVPKSLWSKVGEYCGYDVDATEAVWDNTQDDFLARQILAEWADMTVNDTTNSLTTRLIVGKDPHPQSQFIYTNLSTIFPGYEYDPFGIDPSRYNPGIKIVRGKSIYKGKDPGEGGYAIGYPGIYYDAAVLDVESMHPHSAIRLKIFGEEYTLRFKNILDARLYIKHKEYNRAKEILPERLHKYLEDPKGAKKLSKALKTAINSVYGLTSANFDNKLRDPRNKDNIVAKYGALFMINLEEEVKKRGYEVIHIKTDSIKIANATPEIIQFVMDYGKEYGYTFAHESTYSKMCIVNDAVYIAKYKNAQDCYNLYGYVPEENEEHENQWTATGTQFQVPYVFKTLFSKEPIEFSDLCETKSVTTALYLDFNEKLSDLSSGEDGNPTPDDDPSHHNYQFVGKVGLFCPIKSGCGGGLLLREKNGLYHAATGTKKKDGTAYRWMEAEMVKVIGKEDDIDLDYYNSLCDAAIDTIEKYGDFEQFVSNDETVPDFINIPKNEDSIVPFPMNEPLVS